MNDQLETEEPEDVLLGRPSGAGAAERGAASLDPALPAEIFSFATGRPTQATSPELPRRRRLRPRDEELLSSGSIVDKYRIEGLLGKGGFAAVYRATHLLLGTRVAIKLLRPTVLEREPALAARLCEEARFAARIDHSNVVRIFDVTTQGLTYIVMEYIDGASLAQHIDRSGPLPPAAVLRTGLQVVSGLQAGLEQGLIHRDIKPANILLTRGGQAKIVDFGLARQNVGSSETPCARASIVGTYGYMSPEQADAPESVDFRADIYSLGVTLYEAATGALPFPTNDPVACIMLHRTHPVRSLAERVPGFPPAVSSLVAWMLAKRREDRPTYDELRSAMSQALENSSGP